jgi:ATP-dependent RNA helicase DeaD
LRVSTHTSSTVATTSVARGQTPRSQTHIHTPARSQTQAPRIPTPGVSGELDSTGPTTGGARPQRGPTGAATAFAALGAGARSVAALERLGIETPTLIQAQAIPPLLAGRDVIGQSRTGSGKTIAFGLPLVERLDPRLRRLQALVVVPTRELASQVAEVLAALDGGRGLRVAELIGGRALGPQRDALLAGAQVAVGAPGRVLDHLRQGNLDPRGLRVVVLDEADQMLDAGFAPDVERILAATPPTRQLALFSATLPEWALQLAQRYLKDPVRVQADAPQTRPAPSIAQIIYLVPQGQRLQALTALLDRRRDAEGATLVFGRTKHGVKKLARQLAAQGYPVAALQGNMSQNARDRVIAEFRSGQVPVLLATNVAARGLDVLSIEQVINYELPESAELFTHRVGRTGRMDREGEAITLLTPDDADAWRKLQRDLRVKLEPRPWPQDQMPLREAPVATPAAPHSTVQRQGQPAARREAATAPARGMSPRVPRDGTPAGNGRQQSREQRGNQRREKRPQTGSRVQTQNDEARRPEANETERRPFLRIWRG